MTYELVIVIWNYLQWFYNIILVFMIQYIIWQAELIITIINKAAHKMLPHFMPSHFAHTQIFLFSRLKLLGNMIEHVYYCFSLTCQKLTNWTTFLLLYSLFIGAVCAFFSSVSMSYYLFACLLTFYDEWSITQRRSIKSQNLESFYMICFTVLYSLIR